MAAGHEHGSLTSSKESNNLNFCHGPVASVRGCSAKVRHVAEGGLIWFGLPCSSWIFMMLA